MFLWGDWTFILLIPVLIMAGYFQMKVKGTFKKYSKIRNTRGFSGEQMAKLMLERNGISGVDVKPVSGMLSDNYDPKRKMVNLSEENYYGNSIASVTIAAHEVGHAIQHHNGYAPLSVRSAIFPVANIGSTLAFPLFIAGILFSFPMLIDIGIIFFAGAVFFHFATLPVEFNASSRALSQIETMGVLTGPELQPAKKILSAAAMTYVAATLMAVMNLVRMLILKSQYDD